MIVHMPTLTVSLLAGAALVSACLAMLSAPWGFDLPWLNYAFKPLTTLLIIALAYTESVSAGALAIAVGLFGVLSGYLANFFLSPSKPDEPETAPEPVCSDPPSHSGSPRTGLDSHGTSPPGLNLRNRGTVNADDRREQGRRAV